jgi:hypothetical protein
MSLDWITLLADLATIAAVLFAGAGLLYTGKQLELTRKATGAQLLLQVAEVFHEHDETIRKLRDGTLKGDEFEVLRVMGALESLHILVTKGLVAPEEIDDLHGWRLETLFGNEHVRAELERYPDGWRRLTELQSRLVANRIRSRSK